MSWLNPLHLNLVPTDDSMSFASMKPDSTGIPIPPHAGAFGVKRKHHTHEGIDLYAPEGTSVFAVESGTVVKVEPFTGAIANSPWWLDTYAVYVEGESGVVVYGEINPVVEVGVTVHAGDHIGDITRVLVEDKGRPTSMLHIELHVPCTRETPSWEETMPSTLLDPTPYLLNIQKGN